MFLGDRHLIDKQEIKQDWWLDMSSLSKCYRVRVHQTNFHITKTPEIGYIEVSGN